MKNCPFCRESIHDDAIKCRFCQSMLISLPGSPAQGEEKKPPDDRITYVIDNDIVRFAKFALATLAVFIAVGAYFYGLDLKQSAKEVKDIAKQAQTDMDSLKDVRTEIKELRSIYDDTRDLSDKVHSQVSSIAADADKMHGIVETSQAEFAAKVNEIVDASLDRRLATVLTPEQLAASKETIQRTYTHEQIAQMVTADLGKATSFFAKYGFPNQKIPWAFYKDDGFANVFFDGRKIVFGMGMVNSSLFGPYDSSIVAHEATHKLLGLPFLDQSGAISESICDVVGVLISGSNWTVGRIRGKSPMYIRSLSHPGTAYDTPAMGKDPQPDHMSGYVKTAQDNGGIHFNCGILNKAAYLMCEGGAHHGVTVAQGLGRERTAQLYMEMIKSLPKTEITFKQFKEYVVAAAEKISFSPAEVETVKQSFLAVGI